MKPRTITIVILLALVVWLLRGRDDRRDAARVAGRKAAGTGTLKDSDATEAELFDGR